MALLLRSCFKIPSRYLRNRRKCPFTPYKARWHEIYHQNQAMEALRRAATTTDSTIPSSLKPCEEEEDGAKNSPSSKKGHLLSVLLDSFRKYNCNPTPSAYDFVVKTLIGKSQLQSLHQVLHHLETVEKFETPECFFVGLIKLLGKTGRIEEAVDIFFRIPKFRCVPTVDSLNSLLKILCLRRNFLNTVPRILLMSQGMKIRIDESTLRILVRALCRIKRPCHSIEVMRCMGSEKYCLDPDICSLLLLSLSRGKYLSPAEAFHFLDEIRNLGFVPGRDDYYNMIRLLGKVGLGMDAWEVLNEMKRKGGYPDVICYNMVLNAVEGNHSLTESIFDEMLVVGLVPDISTYNIYLKGLCNVGNVDEGMNILLAMEKLGCKPNLVTYNTLLNAVFNCGDLRKANELLREMEFRGISKSSTTYGIVINGFIYCGDASSASSLLAAMLDEGLLLPFSMVDDIVCGFCDVGFVTDARRLFERVVVRDFSPRYRTWEAMLPVFISEFAFPSTMFDCLLSSSHVSDALIS